MTPIVLQFLRMEIASSATRNSTTIRTVANVYKSIRLFWSPTVSTTKTSTNAASVMVTTIYCRGNVCQCKRWLITVKCIETQESAVIVKTDTCWVRADWSVNSRLRLITVRCTLCISAVVAVTVTFMTVTIDYRNSGKFTWTKLWLQIQWNRWTNFAEKLLVKIAQ